ncbi:MAG: type II toxin-antitoxin system VapC family toxin, partial [marine benthic group bacterium]|nr:type II toxin-antitoxin system VapC family toxin [Candidatus Carthagonibacter metallireducens]
MILDTSAVVAIIFQEPDHEKILRKLLAAPEVGIGAPSLSETGIVVSARLGQDARPLLSRFLLEGEVET